MTKHAFPEDVRQRVLTVLRDQERTLTWLARLLHKSKSWGSAFGSGRGLISHTEMDVVAKATGKPVSYYWQGVEDNGPSTPPHAPLPQVIPASRDITCGDSFDALRYLWNAVPAEQRPVALLALIHALEPFVGGLYATRTPPRR